MDGEVLVREMGLVFDGRVIGIERGSIGEIDGIGIDGRVMGIGRRSTGEREIGLVLMESDMYWTKEYGER